MKENNNKKACRRLYGISALCFAIAYSLYSLVILPLYFRLDSNVDFAGGFLPDALGYIGLAIENIAIFVFYGILISGIYHFGYYGFRGIVGVFTAATVYKYTANVLMSWVRGGAIPTTWIWDLVNIVYYTALELIMLWIVIAIVRRLIASSRDEIPTFERFYDKTNPLMRAALVCSIVTVSVKMFGNVVNDAIFVIEYGFARYLESGISVLLNYLSVVLLVIVVVVLTLNKKKFRPVVTPTTGG